MLIGNVVVRFVIHRSQSTTQLSKSRERKSMGFIKPILVSTAQVLKFILNRILSYRLVERCKIIPSISRNFTPAKTIPESENIHRIRCNKRIAGIEPHTVGWRHGQSHGDAIFDVPAQGICVGGIIGKLGLGFGRGRPSSQQQNPKPNTNFHTTKYRLYFNSLSTTFSPVLSIIRQKPEIFEA